MRYRLPGQLKDRFAQLVFIGLDSAFTEWSGRPGIGTVRLRDNEILWHAPLPAGHVAYTCFNKTELPWPE